MNQDQHAAFVDLIENGIPFNTFLGLKVRFIGEGKCSLSIPFRLELVGDSRRGALHGGVMSMLIDTCGGFCVWTKGNITDRISTIDMRVDYLRPALGKDLVAESKIKLYGSRVGTAHTKVFIDGEPGHVVAEGRSVYNIRRK